MRGAPTNTVGTPRVVSFRAIDIGAHMSRVAMLVPLAVFIVASATTFATAQESHLRVLREKTLRQVLEISSGTRGVLGVAVIDLATGDRFGTLDTLVFPQGSAIKVPILMEVFKQAAEGKFSLSDRITIEHAKTVDGGILQNFSDKGSSLSIHDLCVLMIGLSDNSATNYLIEKVGMQNVNTTMKSLGLKKTKLQRIMMDMAASARGDENVSTPTEATTLLTVLARGEFIDKKTSEEILSILMTPRSPNDGFIKGSIPDETPVAFKQGEVPGVLVEWAFVNLKGRPYVVAIMENYGLETDASDAMKKISKILYDYFWRLSRSSPAGVYKDPSLWK